MTQYPVSQSNQDPAKTPSQGPTTEPDARQKVLAAALEFSKRCFEAVDIEELYLLLTNDLRAIVEFDRSFLVTHLDDESKLVAAGNQPLLEKKGKAYEMLTSLAEDLQPLRRGLLVAGPKGVSDLQTEELTETAKESLRSYLEFSDSAWLLCVPLVHDEAPVAHLILEFFGKRTPDHIEVISALNIAPFLTAALIEKWLYSKKPGLLASVLPGRSTARRRTRQLKIALISAIVLVALAMAIFLIPVPFTVGGEAEIVPIERHVAYCKIEGLVEKVSVTEGSQVTRGQTLATLDPKELDYKVKSAQSQFDLLSSEMALLKASASDDPDKLAESNLVALKRKGVWEDLNYYRWQQGFLNITAPVAGTILTKDIQSLAGKRFNAGEPFCEIVAPGSLEVEVYVPQNRISYVSKGQTVRVFLDVRPRQAYELQVKEISPSAQAVPRLGNIYRVRAPFPDAPKFAMVGMKGVAKIYVMEANLWFIIVRRLAERWQHMALYF